MSSQERSDDPGGGPGYGSAKQDEIFDEAKQDAPDVDDDDDRDDTVPSNKPRGEDGDWPSS